ncbi:MAG: CDP-archaeol synthase, partial [Candidatus Thorarchaeota archaeon]|nr:CDP-archaeol synthase [Candidatus Thorarchaeota archaeon]
GDLTGSFIKRRIDIRSGNPSPVLDQLGFILMGLILAVPFLQPEAIYVIILVTITLGIHWLSNALGYLLGMKKNPW